MKHTRLLALLGVAALLVAVGVAAQQKADDKAVDPVCGMTVTKAKAAATFDYKGTTYYFCAKGCKDAFAKEPEKYLAKAAGKSEPTAAVAAVPHGQGAGMHKMPMGQGGCPMMGGPMGMGAGPMAAGVDRLLLRKDVEWTYERTAAGATLKISSKDPETVKAIQERLAAVKERKEIAASAPASGCSCPNCQMKEPVKK